MEQVRTQGILVIVSGPSGAGKSTLLKRLIREDARCIFSVSHTTRAPRPEERQGEDYFFVAVSEFEQMIAAGEFLEWAQVHGHLYGTARTWLVDRLTAGCDVFLDIDVEGGRQVRQGIDREVSIFILPPSFAALRARLTLRGQDGPTVIERRLENAREEVRHLGEYGYLLVNDELERCYAELRTILRAARLQRWRMQPLVDSILASFEKRG
jgi:guanylate kinase